MLKNKLEALLFSSGRKMGLEELSKLTHAEPDEIQNSLTELKNEYDNKNSSVMLVNEGNLWKLTIREQFLSLVQKIVTETELSKTVTETLAVIAFKYPIKQSDLIKIRTNKAYDHLKELEEMGYISKQKYGRTYLIKLTQKFFEYFDLPEEKLKEKFQDFKSIAQAIEDKEKEIEAIKQEQKAQAEEEKQKDESIKKEIDLMDEEGHEVALETYETKKENPVEEKKEEEKPKFEGPGIKLSKEEEKIVDEKVEKILHPKEEQESEEPKEFEKKEKELEEEPKDLIEAEMEEKKEENQ